MSQQTTATAYLRDFSEHIRSNFPPSESGIFTDRGIEKAIADVRAESPHQSLGVLKVGFNATAVQATHGPETAQELMRAAARRIEAFCGSRVLVAQSEEHGLTALVLPSGLDGLRQVTQGLAGELSTAYQTKAGELEFRPTIGAAIGGENTSTKALLQQAWQTRSSTQSGQGNVYDSETQRAWLRDQRLISDMPEALKQGQFSVVYQPLVGVDKVWSSSEALLRWKHPEFGYVSPEDFIRLAEESKFINKLGNWVLGQACQTARRLFHTYGANSPSISVNVSAKQLENSDFVSTAREKLKDFNLPPHKLIWELTENNLVPLDSPILIELAKLGAPIALDDFGTREANFDYLDPSVINRVKFDRSMLDQDPALLQVIVSSLNKVGITATAEGIEEEAQFAMAVEAGFTTGQGYFFGKPGNPTPNPSTFLILPPMVKPMGAKTRRALRSPGQKVPRSRGATTPVKKI